MQEESVFVEYFGGSPFIRIVDFLITGKDFDYSRKEIIEGADVSRASFKCAWKKLLAKKVVVSTQKMGKVKLFKLNTTDPVVKKLVQFDWEITKIETDKFLSKFNIKK